MPDFEFGDRPAANAFREEHEEHLCPHDDRRMRTVTLVGDAPDRVLDEAAVQAAASREDHSGTGQQSLTDAEKDLGGECDHARDHCENGDPDACEFLKDGCGLDDEQVAEILDDGEEMPGEVYGLKNKLWQQYLVEVAEAAAAINEIHEQYDRDLVSFEELGDRRLTSADIDWNQ